MYKYRVEVIKVIDGDTVDVNIDLGFGVWLKKERVRLYGIDTPESRTRDLEEKKFGNLSKAFLHDALMGDKYSDILLQTHKDAKGKFGRILGEFIAVDKSDQSGAEVELNLNSMLIEQKLAVAYFGQSKADIEKEHLKNREYLYESGKIQK
jgi:micrococcal nuclease